MNIYPSRRSVSGGAVTFIVFFLLVFIGAGYLFFVDQGKFWDYLPFICIPSLVLTLILLIFYFVKKSSSGFVFTLFFVVFLGGAILSGLLGPFALMNSATDDYSNKQYSESIKSYKKILDTYPNSRYAKEALANISESHYRAGNYQDAIFYYEKAISDKVIDGETLETRDIFADSYLKIADSYYETKDFNEAARHYREAVNYLEQIIQKFPETNNAFIAKYKIPEHLFKIADCLKKEKDWDGSIEALKNIIDKYPESDFSKESYSGLFDIYINKAMDIKKNGRYKDSIIEFFKIYDLELATLDQMQPKIKYSQENLLAGIPSNILIQAANYFFSQADYMKPLIVYDYLLTNYPESEFMVTDNLVNIKIRTISEMPYEVMPEFVLSGSFAINGNAKVTLENRTEFILVVYLGGPENSMARLEPKTKAEVEIIAGEYQAVAEIMDPEGTLLYRAAVFEDGKRYRAVYTIKTE